MRSNKEIMSDINKSIIDALSTYDPDVADIRSIVESEALRDDESLIRQMSDYLDVVIELAEVVYRSGEENGAVKAKMYFSGQ